MLPLTITPQGHLTATGYVVASLTRPFDARVDLRAKKIAAATYHRSVAATFQAHGAYRVHAGPRYADTLVTSDAGGYHGFGIYRTNDHLSVQLRSLAIAQLCSGTRITTRSHSSQHTADPRFASCKNPVRST